MSPKRETTVIGDQLYGQVDQTRTLTVCNTDARLYALSENEVLARACSKAISSDQRGCITGRSIIASVMLCETAMAETAMTSVDVAIIFLDFANAFPTLARRWLGLVLRKAGVPLQLAVEFPYEDLHTLFVFGEMSLLVCRCVAGSSNAAP